MLVKQGVQLLLILMAVMVGMAGRGQEIAQPMRVAAAADLQELAV